MCHYFHGKNLGIFSSETAYKFVDPQIKRISFLSSVNRVVFIREMQRVFRERERERERERGTLLFKYRSDEFQRSKGYVIGRPALWPYERVKHLSLISE
jgi:hypothetical protein